MPKKKKKRQSYVKKNHVTPQSCDGEVKIKRHADARVGRTERTRNPKNPNRRKDKKIEKKSKSGDAASHAVEKRPSQRRVLPQK
jgi:hypothetical protein